VPTVTLTGPHRYHTGGRLWKNGEPVEVDQATAEKYAEDPRFRVSFARPAAAHAAQDGDAQEAKRTGGVKITRGKPQTAAGDAQPQPAAKSGPATQNKPAGNDPSTEGAVEL
jgi:hypothetical protein